MAFDFERTNLWFRTLGEGATNQKTDTERLRVAFLDFRKKTARFLEKIAVTLPNLTVHDITHIDALWETADLIIGKDYPINPMEAFVLGSAMLLHDSALCFEAFDDGAEGLRKTTQWADAYAAESEGNSTTDKIVALADFTALRILHGEQAATLIDRAWSDPVTNENIFLLDNSDLRKRYGSVIGKIASSHSWNIEDIESRLPAQINAPGDWPTDWRIDPIKIACILRCADAAHIDNRRAPDFLFALTRRSGISLEHWKAQNWLARPDLDQADVSGETLAFTSSREFGKNDAKAWWIAFDAIQLVDTEITHSNALLSSRPQHHSSPEFSIKRIAGTTSPELMSRYLPTKDWQPWSAKLHVGNVEQLVKSLGGENLYGRDSDHLGTVLRELIQNSRDAIAARQELDPEYKGRVRINILTKEAPSPRIQISDDGIGMSRRVLTGPLLDFGTSFWKTDLVKDEFPGLRSSKFRSIGKFGIGFYSIFMASDDVQISSRRWDRGLDTVCTVSFPNGLSLRPLFFQGHCDLIKGSTSTLISFALNDKYRDKLLTRSLGSAMINVPSIAVSISDYLRTLVCGLDVRVELQIDDGEMETIHLPIAEIANKLSEYEGWLAQISFAKYRGKKIQLSVQRGAKRLRPITVGERLLGLAALNSMVDTPDSLPGLTTIGGLANVSNFRGGSDFIGFMETEARSAKREIGKTSIPLDVLEKWALEQIEILKEGNTTAIEWAAITGNLADLSVDPSPILTAIFYLDNAITFMNLQQIFELLKTQPIAVFKSSGLNHIDAYVSETSFENYPTFRPYGNSTFLSLEMTDGVPKSSNSFIGCLRRYAKKFDRELNFETRSGVAKSLVGPADVVLIRLARSA